MSYNSPVRHNERDTTRGIARAVAPGESRGRPKIGIPEFLKLLEDLRLMKNRALSHDTGRLEVEHQSALANAMKTADRRAKPGDVGDLHRHQAEARGYVDAEHERSKEILGAKYGVIDDGLLALSQYLKAQTPLKDLEGDLTAKEADHDE